MTGIGRFLIATLCGLVLAAGVHIAAILASPYLAEREAYVRILPTLSAEKAQIVSTPGGTGTWLPFPDPAVAVAACAFNLEDGPMRISTRTDGQFLSFSFHGKRKGVFFAITDRAAVDGGLEIVTLTQRQLDEARAEQDESAPSRDVRIVAPEQEGFVLIRVAAPMQSQRPQAEDMAKNVSCTTDRGEES